ncbi:MAG: hypothetical protein K5764_05125 [Prevotella sp.]|nr:hypothetical protein [Prevotella sp.]
MKNVMNKVMAATMMMTLTIAMPAMAGNKKRDYNGKDVKVVVMKKDKKAVRHDKMHKGMYGNVHKGTYAMAHRGHAAHKAMHFAAPRKPAWHPAMRVFTFKVGRHAIRRHAVAKAERLYGVRKTYWNPRTHEMTVYYDARITSARHIMRAVA